MGTRRKGMVWEPREKRWKLGEKGVGNGRKWSRNWERRGWEPREKGVGTSREGMGTGREWMRT